MGASIRCYLVCGLLVAACSSCYTPSSGGGRVGAAKNIVFMVSDGMGLADVTAARIFKGGEDGPPLALETLPQIGYQRTYSANSTVTDSAAAASAWATGIKHSNGQLSWRHASDRPATILEYAKSRQRATGLVATSGITHSTPAAFAAHVSSRYAQGEVARQYIEETQVDVLLGGGFGNNALATGYAAINKKALIDSAVAEHGYCLITNMLELAKAVDANAPKVLGLFTAEAKTPERFRVTPDVPYPSSEPTLEEMTTAALELLGKDPEGFFLMVEGSQVDHANHANDYPYQLSELLGFNSAVASVLNWVDATPTRRRDTLVIIIADHETGGFAINGPYGSLLGVGKYPETGWTTKAHTGVDTVVWSQGPGSELLGCALNNTDLFNVMQRVLKKPPVYHITLSDSDLAETP